MRIRIVKQKSPMLYRPVGDDSPVDRTLPLDDILKIAERKLREYTDADLSSWGCELYTDGGFYIKNGLHHKSTDYGVVICR